MNSPDAASIESSSVARSARRHGLMHLSMLFATACWASNMVAGKETLLGFGALALAQFRVVGAAGLYGIIFFAWMRRPVPRLTRRQWLFFLAMALSGVTFNQLFFIGGLRLSSVTRTGLIVALGPVMVLVLSCLMRLEALTPLKFVGMLVSFSGVAVLTVAKAGQGNGGHWLGDLMLLASSAAFSYYTIQMKEVACRYDAITVNTLTFGLGALLMVPFTVQAVLDVKWTAIPTAAGWGLGFMVVFGSVVPYLLFAFALTELTASRVAAFNYLQPVIATGLGIWLLSERLTLRLVVGGALILLGVYLTERERDEERPFQMVADGGA